MDILALLAGLIGLWLGTGTTIKREHPPLRTRSIASNKKKPPSGGFFVTARYVAFEPMGSTKRASVLDERSAPRRGEDRLKATRIIDREAINDAAPQVQVNPTLSARNQKGPFTGPFLFLAECGCGCEPCSTSECH